MDKLHPIDPSRKIIEDELLKDRKLYADRELSPDQKADQASAQPESRVTAAEKKERTRVFTETVLEIIKKDFPNMRFKSRELKNKFPDKGHDQILSALGRLVKTGDLKYFSVGKYSEYELNIEK